MKKKWLSALLGGVLLVALTAAPAFAPHHNPVKCTIHRHENGRPHLHCALMAFYKNPPEGVELSELEDDLQDWVIKFFDRRFK